ncbi:hypothetical protein Bbelb_119030 [Branchiostoma belcheri]|nr:hypothetical protein Bbelb_119030 [Branchiostoma belcheri]
MFATPQRRRDLIVRTPRGTPPVAGIPPGHISYVTDQMNRIKPMPARLLNPAGASRGYIPDGHRRNWDLSLSWVISKQFFWWGNMKTSERRHKRLPFGCAYDLVRERGDRNLGASSQKWTRPDNQAQGRTHDDHMSAARRGREISPDSSGTQPSV